MDNRGDNRGNDLTTGVTKLSSNRRPPSHSIVSFTAVTSHKEMASAFVDEMVKVGQQMIPDRVLSAEDLLTIFQRALYDEKDRSITMVSGRHLRSRISEQVSRARRYNESFSLMVLKLDNITDLDDYEAIIDTLRERMRQSDLIFTFKYRIVILLPHTEKNACKILEERIHHLISNGLSLSSEVPITRLTFPDPELEKGMEVLDWAENQLR